MEDEWATHVKAEAFARWHLEAGARRRTDLVDELTAKLALHESNIQRFLRQDADCAGYVDAAVVERAVAMGMAGDIGDQ